MRKWLKLIRESKGMTQEEVAKKATISRQYYNFIETGHRGDKMPQKTALKIAEALNFDWQQFYEEQPEGEEQEEGEPLSVTA